MEWEDSRFLVGSSEPTSKILCSECPKSQQRLAVSACSYILDDSFRGCNQPFCVKHAFVVHHIEMLPGLPSSLKQVLQTSNKMEARCCSKCKEPYLKAVSTSSESRWKRPISNCLLAITLLTISMLIFFAASRQILQKMAELDSKCQTNALYSEPLDQCFTYLSRFQMGEQQFLGHLVYRGELACLDQKFKVQRCDCIGLGKFFSILERRCLKDECDPETQYLKQTGRCSTKQGMRKSSDPSRGCMHQQMWREELGICVFLRCPAGYMILSNGYCRNCLAYSDSTYHCSEQFLWENNGGFFSAISGSRQLCPTDSKTGETLPFVDELGQLQCPNSTHLSKYDRSLPPEERLCQESEIFVKFHLGCHFACPPYEIYDFIFKRCFRPVCDVHWYNHLTKGCQTCHSSPKYECIRDDYR